jgi:hypothetical protein
LRAGFCPKISPTATMGLEYSLVSRNRLTIKQIVIVTRAGIKKIIIEAGIEWTEVGIELIGAWIETIGIGAEIETIGIGAGIETIRIEESGVAEETVVGI